MAEGEGTEQDRLVREKDKEWAEQIILPELWEYLARASQQVSDFKFTHGQVKDNSLFMKQPQHQLQMAIDSLVDSGLVLKPQDSKRNPQYTVNRERAVAAFPPQAAVDDDDDAGETEGETPSPTKKRRAGGGVGGSKQQQQHQLQQQLPRKLKKLKKKKKELTKQPGSAEEDVESDSEDDEDDENNELDDEYDGGLGGGDEAPEQPPQPPPPPMPQGPAPPPVPDAVLSAVMEALPGDGNEKSKAAILASMSQRGIEAADVEAVLEFLEAKNKIMSDGDDIYVM